MRIVESFVLAPAVLLGGCKKNTMSPSIPSMATPEPVASYSGYRAPMNRPTVGPYTQMAIDNNKRNAATSSLRGEPELVVSEKESDAAFDRLLEGHGSASDFKIIFNKVKGAGSRITESELRELFKLAKEFHDDDSETYSPVMAAKVRRFEYLMEMLKV